MSDGNSGLPQQAAAIAVRRNGDRVQVCLIRRKGSRKWGIPKGQVDPGDTHEETALNEAWEEAGIPAPLATLAEPAGTVHIYREQPDGLQRETIFVHNLWLPADFTPVCQDGEVVDHRLVPLRDLGQLVANQTGSDVVTADACLVIVDCLRRHGMWPEC